MQRFVTTQFIYYTGQKLIVAGSIKGTLQGADCDKDFYQPYQFLSPGNSRCAFRKSYCSEQGQISLSNGTVLMDRLCRCDYTRGFDFIVRPKQQCQCEPTEEDCSCYLKICSSKEILSPGMLEHLCDMIYKKFIGISVYN